MVEVKRISLVRPTIETRFHIDFDWWRQNDRDWRVYLLSYLCPEHQELFSDMRGEELVDYAFRQILFLGLILITSACGMALASAAAFWWLKKKFA